jgi:hypothetical protein
MGYFSKFPLTGVFASDNVNFTIVTDITKRVAIKNYIKTNFSIFDEYDIQESDTPEILAYNLYGSTEYHWIILLMNDIIDPRFEWPLTQEQLVRYARNKYGETDEEIYATHHYEADIDDSTIVDFDDENFPNKVSISNMDYEININETKRRIKILKPQYVAQLNQEFEKIINV